ncbi:MAG TPA: DapH/DapD/GlmU-related protein [Anaeromyxobacteraceae bacterium]|nr:DapH/DapD/GlmU-related protein [Anaeromyxobacteraceae bacterium]
MARSSLGARLFTPFQLAITVGLFAEVSLLLGVAAFPAVEGWLYLGARLPATGAFRALALCVAAPAGYFVFGLTLLLVLPVARVLTFSRGTPVGRFDYLSLGAWQWASFNALTLVLRFTFLNWIRVTPFLPLYHRLMGMAVGSRVQINTAVIADQNLISIGDDTVVGGDVTLVAHVAERGQLVTAPVRIGRNVTVGLMAVILPGCEIGDGAVIAAGAVLSKGTRVGEGEIWAGVPARCVGQRHLSPPPAG